MSTNSSDRLLKGKIDYKKELLPIENSTTKESIKPVEKEAVSPKKASLIKTMFTSAVNSIKAVWETDYAHEFAKHKAISSFMKCDVRSQKSVDEGLGV